MINEFGFMTRFNFLGKIFAWKSLGNGLKISPQDFRLVYFLTSICHREDSGAGVLLLEVLVSELKLVSHY